MQLYQLLVIGLIGLTTYTSSTSGLPLESVGGKKVYLHNTSMNWYHAFQFCAKNQLRLLTIDSSLENFYIGEYIKKKKIEWIWTSGTDLTKEGEWKWMTTGRSFVFNGFFRPKPDNYNHNDQCITEDCLAVGFSPTQQCMLWEDIRCSNDLQFMCEVIV